MKWVEKILLFSFVEVVQLLVFWLSWSLDLHSRLSLFIRCTVHGCLSIPKDYSEMIFSVLPLLAFTFYLLLVQVLCACLHCLITSIHLFLFRFIKEMKLYNLDCQFQLVSVNTVITAAMMALVCSDCSERESSKLM